MEILEKLEPIFIFGAIILGLFFRDVGVLNQISPSLITIFLAAMLFTVFLDIPLEDIKNSFSNRKFTATSIIINFIWTPLFGYFLGNLFLNGNIDLFIGFLMLILTPCTDWYLVFTKMSRGNVPLSLSILPINLVLQVLLLPIYLLLFFSSSNIIQLSDLVNSLLTFIIIPFVFAQIVKYLFGKNNFGEHIISKLTSCQLLFLCVAIFALFNSEASSLFKNFDSIVHIFIPLILFFMINFLLDLFVSKEITHFDYEEYASLTLTTLARNSPLALAIAIRSFPNNELIAIALVIGPLIELPILYIVSQILNRIHEIY